MKIVSFIVLGLILILLLHIANELRKGKSVVFVFGKCVSVASPQAQAAQPYVPIIAAPAGIVNTAAQGFQQGLDYGKSILKGYIG